MSARVVELKRMLVIVVDRWLHAPPAPTGLAVFLEREVQKLRTRAPDLIAGVILAKHVFPGAEVVKVTRKRSGTLRWKRKGPAPGVAPAPLREDVDADA